MGAGKNNRNGNRAERSAGKGNLVWKILLALCLAGAVIAIVILIRDAAESRRQAAILESLAAMTDEESEGSGSSGQESEAAVPQDTPEPEKTWKELSLEEKNQKLEEAFGIQIPEKEIDFEDLQEQVNPDIYAWLYIPDSTIDFPVLQHAEDNSYYLNYNIDGSKGRPGCIYTENTNAKDFSDHNTVLYGHNMRNGTMFAGLHKFEDADYFAENPYIYVYTPDEVFVYRIFGAYEFSNIHLLAGYETETEEGFGDYLDDVMAVRSMNSNFNPDVTVTEKDRIITLSTCVSGKADKRWLVQGVLLRVDGAADETDASSSGAEEQDEN